MKIRTNLSLVFGILLLIIAIVVILNQTATSDVKKRFIKYTTELQPTIKTINHYDQINNELQLLLLNRLYNPQEINTIENSRIKGIIEVELPYLKTSFHNLNKKLSTDSELKSSINLPKLIENQISLSEEVIRTFSEKEDYLNTNITGKKRSILETKIKTLTVEVERMTKNLLYKYEIENKNYQNQLSSKLDRISSQILYVGIIGIVIGLLFMIQTISKIDNQISKLQKGVLSLRKGDLDIKIDITEKNELADLTVFFNEMIDSLKENIKLNKSHEIAQKSAKLKDQFLANMSHEIRTPMNAIIGLSGLLMKKLESLNEKQLEYISAINLNSNNLLGIINDILDFSKIESGKVELSNYPFNLNENLSNLIYTLTNVATKKNLTLKLITSESFDYFVYGDWIRLNQILTNILSNAIKFTDEGDVVLSVTKISENTNSVELRFSIKDNGIGIPVEKQQLIFEAFSQANESTTRVYGGTGLGLSIVKNLIALFNSSIQIESEVGKGTEMYFTLDLQKNDDSGKLIVEDQTQNKYSKFDNFKLLIIEEDIFMRTIIADIIHAVNSKINLYFAESAGEAIPLIKDNNYDLILMDCETSDINNKSLVSIIRDELKLETPILLMAEEENETQTAEFNKFEKLKFITKTFDEEEFSAVLLSS